MKATSRTVHTYAYMGVKVNDLAIPDLHEVISDTIEADRQCVIASQNLHSVYINHINPAMREYYEQVEYVRIDGMSLVLLGNVLGFPLSREHRVTWVDWLRPLLAQAVHKNWKVYYLGAKPGVANRGADILRAEFPGLQLATSHGFFDARTDSVENQGLVQRINEWNPHILMVGMGMPRQEMWIKGNRDKLHANVILPCGACIEYFAGVIPTPPRWLGRMGLEWLFRLVCEPKRLWKRYLIEPWAVGYLFMRSLRARHKRDTSS